MGRKTKNCNFDFIEIGFRGNKWHTGCGKEILYFAPLGQGVASPPLPTDNGMRVCPWCAKPIRLTSRKPKQHPKIPVAPPPEPKEERTLSTFQTAKPSPFSKPPAAQLQIDKDHNTYEGWKEIGFQVMAGHKMAGRDPDGVPLFHRSSVKEQGNSRPTFGRRDLDPLPPPPGYPIYQFDDDDIPY